MSHTPPKDEQRPRVTAVLVDPDDAAAPLLRAVGRVVFAVAALEKSLQLELSRLTLVRDATSSHTAGCSLREQLDAMDTMAAGQLLAKLRKLGLPKAVDQRIAAVIERRNVLVHHLYEDAEIVRALDQGGDALEAVARQLDRLALDAAELAVELQLFAVPKLETMIGISMAQALEMVREIDIDAIEDPRERRQVEAVRALSSMTQLADLPVGQPPMASGPSPSANQRGGSAKPS